MGVKSRMPYVIERNCTIAAIECRNVDPDIVPARLKLCRKYRIFRWTTPNRISIISAHLVNEIDPVIDATIAIVVVYSSKKWAGGIRIIRLVLSPKHNRRRQDYGEAS